MGTRRGVPGLILTLAAALLLHLSPAPAAAGNAAAPVIAIIIDDLGHQAAPGRRAVRLPGPVACAFLPHSPHTRPLAREAHARNKEVLLHLPMQPVAHRRLDPGALTLDMTEHELIATLEADIASVPHVTGVNNHMGSLLTRHPGHMLWLMRALRRNGPLFFVDSRTTAATVARQVALENGVPSLARDVFLDTHGGADFVARQFQRLLDAARRHGSALGIGHPYPATLALLERELPRLDAAGVRLVPVSELIRARHEGGEPRWQASWSR